MAFMPLINRGSNVSLDVHRSDIFQNGAIVQQWDYNGTPNQHWEFRDAGDDYVWLCNQESGKALDVHRSDIYSNAARVQQWDYNGTPNQQWQRINVGDGWFWLRNRESGKSLDVHVFDITMNGTRIQQWDYNGTWNQMWREGGDTNVNKFVFGKFIFAEDYTAEQICTLVDGHRLAYSCIRDCSNLSSDEQNILTQTYQRAIFHRITSEQNVLGIAILDGYQIWVNVGLLFPRGKDAIAQTLIHEMMHCAGYNHPSINPGENPFLNHEYITSAPVRSEVCIVSNQINMQAILNAKWSRESCAMENGQFTIRRF